jgi:hypothetical protein
MILACPTLQMVQKVALHGGRPDTLASAEAASVDAIQMLLLYHLLEALAGSLARLNARQALAKRSAAVQATALAHFQLKNAAAETPVVVPDSPPAPAFVPQMRSAAMRARYRPRIPGRYRNRAAVSLNGGNLVLGPTQQDLRIGQNVISQDCFTNLGSGAAPVFDQEPNGGTSNSDRLFTRATSIIADPVPSRYFMS